MRPIDSIAPIKGTSNRAGKFRPARFSYLRIQRGGGGERLRAAEYVERIRRMVSQRLNQTRLEKVDSFMLHPSIMRFLFTSHSKGSGLGRNGNCQ